MTVEQLSKHLLNILSYDSLVNVLSISDRHWLHKQVARNGIETTNPGTLKNAPEKVQELSNLILERNWKRPKLRYNADRELEVWYQTIGWQKFNQKRYE